VRGASEGKVKERRRDKAALLCNFKPPSHKALEPTPPGMALSFLQAFFLVFCLYLSISSAQKETPKIFGVGLSKTGTSSLGQALELLGLNNIHHDRAFVPFIYDDQDWTHQNRSFEDLAHRLNSYDAAEDLPTAAYYEQLLQAFPDSYFILTIREVDGWYDSFEAHHHRMIKKWGGSLPFRIQALHKKVYGSVEPDRVLWKQHFTAHNRRVIETIPEKQLLVLDIVDKQEGWSQLCSFLNINIGPCVPTLRKRPFPHVNQMEEDGKSEDEDLLISQSCFSREEQRMFSPEKNAYVMLLGFASLKQNQDYFTAAFVLAQSLRNSGTTADIVALIYPDIDSKDLALLQSFGIKTKIVSSVGTAITNDPGPFGFREAAIYRAKLRALQLVEYSKIMFLDLDLIVLKNPDPLFSQKSDLVGVAGGNSPFNAGIFVLRPSCQDFIDVQDIAMSDSFTVENGWFDYGPFPHWSRPGDTSDWSFYGSHVEQGLMYYYYGIYKKTATLLPLGAWDEYAVHFVGSHKPWLMSPDTPRKFPTDFDKPLWNGIRLSIKLRRFFK